MKDDLRILIIEDNPGDADLIKEMLSGQEARNFYLAESPDLGKAMSRLEEDIFDLILLDLNLPDSEGIESVKTLYLTFPFIPIIVLSGMAEEEVALSALEHGAQDYLIKGQISESLLLRSIRYSVERHNAEIALRESEERFRLLAENAQDLIYRLRLVPKLEVEYVSPAATSFTGYTPREHYQNPHLFMELIYPEDRPFLNAVIKGDVPVGQPYVMRWIHRSGEIIWAEHKNVPVYDDNGELMAIEGIARNVNERVEIENYLRQSREKIKSLSMKLLQAYEHERSRLARELHDEIGQALTAVKLDLQMLNQKLNSQESWESLNRSITMINDTIVNVRKQIFSLRSPSLDESEGLEEMVKNMAREICFRAGVKANIRNEGLKQGLPWEVEIALYRCIQEALTNVGRHANANNVYVNLDQEDGMVHVSIKDDGQGFAMEIVDKESPKVGLKGMEERVWLVDGNIEINSVPGQGTEIDIKVPVPEDSEV